MKNNNNCDTFNTLVEEVISQNVKIKGEKKLKSQLLINNMFSSKSLDELGINHNYPYVRLNHFAKEENMKLSSFAGNFRKEKDNKEDCDKLADSMNDYIKSNYSKKIKYIPIIKCLDTFSTLYTDPSGELCIDSFHFSTGETVIADFSDHLK